MSFSEASAKAWRLPCGPSFVHQAASKDPSEEWWDSVAGCHLRQSAEDLLQQYSISSSRNLSRSSILDRRLQLSKLFLDAIADPNIHQIFEETDKSIILSHGSDDRLVSVRHSRRVLHILQDVGIAAKWKEFAGAEAECHWIKQPEGIE
ncbi:Alpha/Beta hydrolase protein [Penicillium atrosanguineum]|nr:Alpha/Beta hydrolase protein [Penicillium atrosanguineum]